MIKHLTPRTEKELKQIKRKELWKNSCYFKQLVVSGIIFLLACIGTIIDLAFLGLLVLSGILFFTSCYKFYRYPDI